MNERKHIWQCQQLSNDGTWRNILPKPTPKETAIYAQMWLIKHHKNPCKCKTRIVDVTQEVAS